MEEDEEKSGYFTNYYGGIIHVKSCTNHVNCITEYRVLWFGCIWWCTAVPRRLSNQDLVGNPAAFYVHMQLMKREGTDMQKGIYTLNSSMTYEEIIRVIYGL